MGRAHHFARGSFNHISRQISSDGLLKVEIVEHTDADYPFPCAAQSSTGVGQYEIDKRCLSNLAGSFSDPVREVNFNALSYQIRGKTARLHGHHEKSLRDFKQFEVQAQHISGKLPAPDRGFILGFTKALPKEIYASVKGITKGEALFVADLIPFIRQRKGTMLYF